MTYIKESSKKRKSRKVSTTGIFYVRNIYLKFRHIIHTLTVFFIKTKELMFYSVVMAAIGAFAKV